MELTVTITGSGDLRRLQAPDLTLLRRLSRVSRE